MLLETPCNLRLVVEMFSIMLRRINLLETEMLFLMRSFLRQFTGTR